MILMIHWFPGNLPHVQADPLEAVCPMNFGEIILAPGGDTIEIDASSVGESAVSHVRGNGKSVIVDDGYPGKLTYKCQAPGERITMLFPSRVEAENHTNSHYINGFSRRSTHTPIVCEGTETIELHIGGLLHLKKGQPYGEYEFELPITIQSSIP